MDEKTLYPDEDALMAQEEKCRKAMRTVAKAIAMRMFVSVLLIWIVFSSGMTLLVSGMMVLVLLINLSGLLPLGQEWKKRRAELKGILAQYE